MATRRTAQERRTDGKYEKNVRCEKCGASLGQLDDGQWEFGPGGEFWCPQDGDGCEPARHSRPTKAELLTAAA